MNFKESVYPVINGRMLEKYEETGISDTVEKLIYEGIGDISKNIEQYKLIILNDLKAKKTIEVKNVKESKYKVGRVNLYQMKKEDFKDIIAVVKECLVKKKAIENLIKDKKVEIINNTNIIKGYPSNADIEINIDYSHPNQSGNVLVYIYDLYFDYTIKSCI